MMKLFGFEIITPIPPPPSTPTNDHHCETKQQQSPSLSSTNSSRSRSHTSMPVASSLNPNPNPKTDVDEEEVSIELKLWSDPWVIKKRMTDSDLNGLSRLLLPRKEVEKYVVPQMSHHMLTQVKETKGGLTVNVVDLDDDDNKHHCMGFDYWPSSHSYVLNRTWSSYVKYRGLHVNDLIGLFWDRFSAQFYIKVLERATTTTTTTSMHPEQAALPLKRKRYNN